MTTPFHNDDDQVVARIGLEISSDQMQQLREAESITRAMAENITMGMMSQRTWMEYVRELPQITEAARQATDEWSSAIGVPGASSGDSEARKQHEEVVRRDERRRERDFPEHNVPSAAPPPQEDPQPDRRFSTIEHGSSIEQLASYRSKVEQADDNGIFELANRYGLLSESLDASGEYVNRQYRGKNLEDVLSNDMLRGELLNDIAQRGMSYDGQTREQVRAALTQGRGLLTSSLGRGQFGQNMSGLGNFMSSVGQMDNLGSFARIAGPAGAGIAALAGANQVIQEVGSTVQGYRSDGQIRGGGFYEGLGYEMQARSIAMNPFIDVQQARQMVFSALEEGYSGASMDSVLSFMQKNLTDMSISISDSMKLMKKNVEEGGQSLTGLNINLASMKSLAQDSDKSLADMQQDYMRASSMAIDAGVSGDSAGSYAMHFSQMFAQGTDGRPNPLGEFAPDLMSAMLQTPMHAQTLKRELGLSATTQQGIIAEAIENHPQDVMRILWDTSTQNDAAIYMDQLKSGAPPADVAAQYAQHLNTLYPGAGITPSRASMLLQYQMGEENPAVTAQNALDERFEITENETSGWGNFFRSFGTALGNDGAQLDSAQYHIQAIRNLVDAGYNLDDMEVVNPDTGERRKLDMNNYEMLKDLVDGNLNLSLEQDQQARDEWFEANKAKYGLEGIDTMDINNLTKLMMSDKDYSQLQKARKDFEAQMSDGQNLHQIIDSGMTPEGITGAGGGAGFTGLLTIDLTEDAKRLISVPGYSSLYPTKADANAGYPGANTIYTPPSERD